jgi:hypothetical protein
MSPLTQPQKEELRFALREQLVAAQAVALDAAMLARRLARARALDFTPPPEEVAAALSLLVGLGQATATPAPLGATLFYQATAAGILAHERGQ